MNPLRVPLLLLVWRHSSAHSRSSIEEFLQSTEGWQVEPIRVDGVVVGATLVNGPEIHLASWERPKGSARATARSILRKVVDQHGFAITKVLKDNPAGLAFCLRLGFEIGREEAGVIHLTCKEPRHA